jgi:hypothetical protein
MRRRTRRSRVDVFFGLATMRLVACVTSLFMTFKNAGRRTYEQATMPQVFVIIVLEADMEVLGWIIICQ